MFDLKINQSTFIPLGTVYRLENLSVRLLQLLEFQVGDQISEEDIVRLEDDYNREHFE